ncbi:MAG: HDOD domain-containing protein [Syntrophotaleaceae bacterium]
MKIQTVDQEAVRQAIEKLPLFSPNALNLLQVIADPDHDLDDVVRIVKFDSALTVRVLKIVNSPVYGLVKPVTSIERALSYLGERTVVSIAIEQNAGDLLQKTLVGYHAQQGDLWRHDLFAAIASREVARHARHELEIDLAFTAGLLHDIGKSVFSSFWEGASQEALEHIDQGEVRDYLEAEQVLAGMDHTHVGLEISRHWQLPQALQMAIRYHHQPEKTEEEVRPLVYAVHLGDIIAMMAGFSTGSDGMQYHLDRRYQDYFDINSTTLARILLNSGEEFRQAEASMANS